MQKLQNDEICYRKENGILALVDPPFSIQSFSVTDEQNKRCVAYDIKIMNLFFYVVTDLNFDCEAE